jgi:hypothetical protein
MLNRQRIRNKKHKMWSSTGQYLGPLLYVLHTSDIPTSDASTTGTFADDTAIFATEDDPVMASFNLQEHLNLIGLWLYRWKI